MNTAKPPTYASIPVSAPPPSGHYYVVDQSPAHRARNRFLKALAFVVLGLFAWHLIMPHHYGRHGWPRYDDAPSAHGDGTPCAGSHIHLTEDDVCADWVAYDGPLDSDASFPHSVHATFNLPVSSDRLFVISQGSLAHGELNVFQGDAESDEVEVHVVASYHTDQALSRAKVCALHRGDNDDGLGIFTPTHGNWHFRDQLRFIINVKLPASGSSVLDVKHFDTDIHNFRHTFSDLEDSVVFQKLTVHSSNGDISAKSLFVEEGALKTSNGAIIGHYNSSSSLELITSNALIHATVGLLNADEETPTHLVLKTSNGRLDSDLHLYSTARDNSAGGAFVVSARTSNAALSLHHATAPVDSLLTLDTHTSNSPATVSLHPTFEGTYSASTSNSGIVVSVDDHAEDPSGRGRQRVSHIYANKGKKVEGSVYWGEEKKAGDVVVKTSNSPVTIYA